MGLSEKAPNTKGVREMAVFRWGEWAEVVMRMLVEVKPGENLLIVADTWTDMEIAIDISRDHTDHGCILPQG